METFYKHVKTSSERCAMRLEEEWLQECCDIIENLRDSVEQWMPQDNQVGVVPFNMYEVIHIKIAIISIIYLRKKETVQGFN